MTGPCVYPGCGAPNNDPTPTADGVCPRCQRRFARLLGWLVLDWVNLHTNLPGPMRRNQQERRTTQQIFGHPAEWASDTAAQIGAVLNATHDALADHLGDRPPPHPLITERLRVRAAWIYLECRIPDLSRTDFAADTAIEMSDLHGRTRARLGLSRPRQILPTPCPGCELRTLYRTIDIRRDFIECGSCGHLIQEDHYPFYTRMVLDMIIDDAA